MVQGKASLPYTDQDVELVLTELTKNRALLSILGRWIYPRAATFAPGLMSRIVQRQLRQRFRGIDTIAGFQMVIRDYVERLVTSTISELEVIGLDSLDPNEGYLFLSNHRDIAGDSMLLNLALHRAGLNTVFIAVGDNLIEQVFATDLMRLNKSFFINRTGENPRQVYRDLATSSSFIQDSIVDGHSIWLAQSEGRAKDAIDVTDESVLKMLQLSDRKMPLTQKVQQLNIVPLCLSYEFDPLDVHKASELAAVATAGEYHKQPGEDLMNLAKGLSGAKGRVQLKFGERLTGNFESIEALAEAIDDQIVRGTRLYPINFWAAKQVDADFEHPALNEIASDQAGFFEQRLAGCPEAYRAFWLQNYANPVPRVLAIDESQGKG